MAEKSYQTPEVRGCGQEELPDPGGQGTLPRGATPSKERLLHRHRKAERSYSMFKVRRGGNEKIPLVQGKEQQLHFAGAAMKIPHVQGKRNPSKMVGVVRGHQRSDTLKP